MLTHLGARGGEVDFVFEGAGGVGTASRDWSSVSAAPESRAALAASPVARTTPASTVRQKAMWDLLSSLLLRTRLSLHNEAASVSAPYA